MEIIKIVVGDLRENCYLLIKDNNVIVIDPGDEAEKIINKIGNLKVLAILITHAHFDHVGALDELINKYNTNVYYNNINNEMHYKNLINVKEDKYEIEDYKFEVIYTPGHRNDLVTYYFYEDNIMFTGDFLFKDTIGRTDLEYSSIDDMEKSLKKISKYNDAVIYPGHGSSTFLEYEKKNNDFLRRVLIER